MTDKVVKAEVRSFEEDCIALYLDWESGRMSAYEVESIPDAINELNRLKVPRQRVQWKIPQAA